MAYGWLLINHHSVYSDDGIFASGKKTCGMGSSNIAEYRALIAGLQGAINEGVEIIHIIGDSQLIIKQVMGVFKTKKPILIQHRDYVISLLENFDSFSIKWVPRRQNRQADALVNEVFNKRNGKCNTK